MKKLTAFLCGILSVAIMVIAPFLNGGIKGEKQEKSVILSLWQIDSFEGGYGSRTAFLRRVILGYTKKNPNVSVLVTSHTPSSAQELIDKGILPDVISYGPSSVELQGYAKELDIKGFSGGEVKNKIFAYPFLRGGYFVIEKGSSSNDVIISSGEYSSSEVACLFSGISVNVATVLPHEEAYSLFLRRENACLIGSQRDIVRLSNRGEEFRARAIEGYSDLYQYLSITSKEHGDYAKQVVLYLLSESVQSKLGEVKMFSVTGERLYSGDDIFSSFEGVQISYTLSPFSPKSHLVACKEEAIKTLNEKGDKGNALKYLKQL